MAYLRKVFSTSAGLLKGMGLTLWYFVRPSTIITQQYPENRETLEMFDAFRGKMEFLHDPETGKPKCIACNMCVQACPNGSIILEGAKDLETKKRYPTLYTWHSERCTYCGLCVEACPVDAIRFNQEFENAVYDRDELIIEFVKPQNTEG